MAKKFLGLVSLLSICALTLASCQTSIDSSHTSSSGGSISSSSSGGGSGATYTEGSKKDLTITTRLLFNGVEDTEGTYGTITLDTRDDNTGIVSYLVKSEQKYGVLNIIARDSNRKLITTSHSTYTDSERVGKKTVKYNYTRINLNLTDSNINLTVYLSDNAKTDLSDDTWQILLDLKDSPFFAAHVTSDEMNSTFGSVLDFDTYMYLGKKNSDDDYTSYVTSHTYYSGNDVEGYSFVRDDEGNMATTFLGTDNTQQFKTVYSTSGSPMSWDSSTANVNIYTATPMQLFTWDFDNSGYAPIDDAEALANLQSSFAPENLADGTIKFTATDKMAANIGYYILALHNSVYSGNLSSNGPTEAKFEIIVDPTNKYVESMTLTESWLTSLNETETEVFDFNISFTVWNDASNSEGIPGSWNSRNTNITSFYKDVKNFAFPTYSSMAGDATQAIADLDLIKKIQQGNYTLSVSSRTVGKDGWIAGLGDSDKYYNGSIKVCLNETDISEKKAGVRSYIPVVVSYDEDTSDATGYYEAGALGAYNYNKSTITAVGINDLDTVLTNNRLNQKAFSSTVFTSNLFGFAQTFLNEEKNEETGAITFSQNFKEQNVTSTGLTSAVYGEITNPFDFAFGQNPNLNNGDESMSEHYGYLGTSSTMKNIDIHVYEDKVEIELTAWIRAYGSNMEFSVEYTYTDIGTTALSAEELAGIGKVTLL